MLSANLNWKLFKNQKSFSELKSSEIGEKAWSVFINGHISIRHLAQSFGILGSKLFDTPVERNLFIEKSNIESEYPGVCNLIDGFLFIAHCTHLYLLYSVNYLSKFQNCANKQILKYVKHILKYILFTDDYGLIFESKGKHNCVAFIDASFLMSETTNTKVSRDSCYTLS